VIEKFGIKEIILLVNEIKAKRIKENTMLNLYLAPTHHPTYVPSEAQINALIHFLSFEEIIHLAPIERDQPYAFSSGLQSMNFFNQDAKDALLPAELSFEKLELVCLDKPLFLPRSREQRFEIECKLCHDPIDTDDFYHALDRYETYLSLDILKYPFTIECLSCQSQLTTKQLNFQQNVTWASAWIFIEEIGSTRLNSTMLKEISRIWGEELHLIPEQLVGIDDYEDSLDWVKPSRLKRNSKRKHK
jgi:hypothetical protein